MSTHAPPQSVEGGVHVATQPEVPQNCPCAQTFMQPLQLSGRVKSVSHPVSARPSQSPQPA
jgi:hypothetical protein